MKYCNLYCLNYREIRLNSTAVGGEVEVLQFCGPSSNHCLQSLQYTSGTSHFSSTNSSATGCHRSFVY